MGPHTGVDPESGSDFSLVAMENRVHTENRVHKKRSGGMNRVAGIFTLHGTLGRSV
jgi:hypothetical protein